MNHWIDSHDALSAPVTCGSVAGTTEDCYTYKTVQSPAHRVNWASHITLDMDSLEEKRAFFNQLKPTHSDDEFDTTERRERRRGRGFFKKRPKPSGPPAASSSKSQTQLRAPQESKVGSPRRYPKSTPRRVVSAPVQVQRASTQIIKGTPNSAFAQSSKLGALMNGKNPEIIIVDDTPIPETARPLPRSFARSNTTPLLPSKRPLGSFYEESPSQSITMKRRKQAPSVKLRPEGEQIFKGLFFFYIPDNDIAPARRLRITKAREHGATWTRTPINATHIVVDKSINYKDISSVLASANKASPPRVVNEDYPLDCLQFKSLLQSNQKKYLLSGQAVVDERPSIENVPSSSEDSVQSLQLKAPPKNPKKWDYVPPAGTPSRSEESSQPSRIAGTQTPVDSQAVILDLEPLIRLAEEVSYHEEDPPNAESSMSSFEKVLETANSTADISTHEEGGSGVQSHEQDELSEYITMMLKYKDLPLDVEEEDTHSVLDLTEVASDADGSGSEGERNQRRKSAKKRVRSGRKDLTFEDRFACNSAGVKNANAGNPNTRTIEVLQLMADYYDRVNDHWRTTAYRKAISTLKRQDQKITTEAEAFRLPNIGQRLAQKIEEIVTTDKLKRLECAQDEPMNNSLQVFLKIYGVGLSQAQQWYAQGFRTLSDLKQKAKLSPNQLIGIEHYDDLNTRIPRRDVEALGSVVRRAAEKIDPEVELIVGGSYRRGAVTSGDIDLIVTKPNTNSSGELRPFLDTLVQRLEGEEFLVARLASSRSAADGSKWHGCCVLPKIKGFNDTDYRPIWRRIDFLLVPEAEIGAALIYFTGNDIFNRSIRLLASKKGMRLNQRGLYKDVMRGPGREKLTTGDLVEGRDEKRIFEILGVKWREPHERWC